jgi:hypothetical protein
MLLLLCGGMVGLSSCDIVEGLAGSVIDIDDPADPNCSNPLDRQGSNYVIPEAEIVAYLPGTNTAVDNEAVIDTPSVDFTWIGKPDSLASMMTFRYRLNNEEWSEWADGSGSFSYRYLDDLDHSFQVEAKYEQQEEADETYAFDLTINAINGPGLTYFPREPATLSPLDTLEVDVYLDDVTDIAGVKSVLKFDTTKVQIDTVQAYDDSGLLNQNGGTVIYLEGPNEDEEFVINMLNVDGDPAAVSGSGAIALVKFVVREMATPGETELSFGKASSLRTANNQNRPIKRYVSKKLVIE